MKRFLAARTEGARDITALRRPGSPVLFAVSILIIIASFGVEDRNSCLRTHAVRAADRAYFTGVAQRALLRAHLEHGVVRRLDLQTYRSALAVARANHPLDCSLPTPETN